MADRSIVTRIRAEASQFLSTMKQVESAAKGVGKSAEAGVKQADGAWSKMSESLRDNGQAWDEVSSKSLIAGGAIAAALGLAAREAINWESAWAGVQKTVDGTDAEMASLEESLRGLTKVLPATHEEIAGVAEAAGQLGVARGDLVRFTEVAIGLGESTNLSAEEASTGLAQLANVMGTTAREGVEGYSKLGSALVALGNNGASTEKDILAMSLRIAGAGTVIGASEADVLALSNALASVGIEAQIGGGVMSRVMLTINSAVAEGGETMAEFARVSGMSAQEFATRWQEDPVAVIGQFVAGLGNVTASGGDAATTLADLGLAGTENASVLLRAAGASDMLTASLELGAQAWDENSALATEAETRYATMESQLQIARNSMRDAAIDAGSVLAPALVKVAEFAASAANAFASMPEPVQGAAVGLAAVASAGLLLVGGGIKVVRTAQELGDALGKIGASGPKAAAGVNAAKSAAAGLALALGAVVAAGILMEPLAGLPVEQLTQDLLGAEDAVSSFNAILAELAVESKSADSDIRGFGDALKYSLDPPAIGKVQNALGGLVSVFSGENTSDIAIAGQRLTELDAVLAGLASSGNGAQAVQMFNEFAAEAEAAGYSTEELMSVLPQYAEVQAGAANATSLAADSTAGWAEEARAAQEAATAGAQEVRDFASAILEQHDAALTASNANVALAAQFDALTEAVKENTGAVEDGGEAFDLSSEKGRNAQTALNEYAAQALATAEANLTNGASVDEVGAALDDARGMFITAATNMGLTEAAANALADEFGLTSGTAATLKSSIEAIPNDKLTTFRAKDNASSTISYIKRGIDGLRDRTVTVRVVQQGSTLGGLTQADGGMLARTAGGLVQAFANGGTFDGTFATAQPQIRPYGGPGGVLWGEEGSGPWEAFISGHPAKKDRSRAIAAETVSRLGGEINWRRFADGGMFAPRAAAPAPAPASTTGGTMRIEGVLDTPFGPSQVRGVVRSELDTVGRSLGGI